MVRKYGGFMSYRGVSSSSTNRSLEPGFQNSIEIQVVLAKNFWLFSKSSKSRKKFLKVPKTCQSKMEFDAANKPNYIDKFLPCKLKHQWGNRKP